MQTANLVQTVEFRGQAFCLPKRHDIGNSSRIMRPEETLRNVKPLFPMVGLTRLGNITGLDRVGLPVAVAIRPNSRSLAQSSGKGIDMESALASAAMESLELYFGEQINQSPIRASYNEIRRDVAVPAIEDLYLSRYSLFHPDRREDWLIGWDILNQQETAVPYHSVSVDFTVLNNLDCPASFTMDSNGLASGNHFLEAVLSGLYEVIERDGVSCHTEAERLGIKKQRIELDTVQDADVQRIAGYLLARGLVPTVLDCTSDIGVPVMEAFVYDTASNLVPIAHGYGAHLNPSVAILRALTEAVQARTLIISGGRDDLFKDIYRANRLRYMNLMKVVQANHVYRPMTLEDRTQDSFEADILYLLERLREAGLPRAIVLDLAPPDLGVSVVRVVVPGLEGYFYYGYNPRRRARQFVERLGRQSDDRAPAPEDSTHTPAGGII